MQIYRRGKFPTYDDFINAKEFENQTKHLQFCTDYTLSNGLVLEFGVFNGRSINRLARKFNKDIVFGFDSFEGLPTHWYDVDGIYLPKGTFDVKQLPEVKRNVRLVKGWFEDTIPKFLDAENEPIIKLLHIDCDLYSSTYTVLSKLNHKLIPGTIIIFDELANWMNEKSYNYKEGEWKALEEWTYKFNREFTILARGKHCQASIIVR